MSSGLNKRFHLLRLAFPDQVAQRRRYNHNLKRRRSCALFIRQKLLRNYSLQTTGKLDTYLPLLLFRKHIYHTVHRFRRTSGMKGSKYKMTGFRCRYGNSNCFQVAKFSNGDYIRVRS